MSMKLINLCQMISLWGILASIVLPFLVRASDLTKDKGKKATIAIVRDGHSDFFDNLEKLVRKELHKLLKAKKAIRYETEEYNANWDLEKIEGLVLKATHSEDIDVVLVLGIIGTIKVVNSREEFSKPVVAGVIQEGGFKKLPYNDQRQSTRPNLTYVISPVRTLRDLKTFKELCDLDKIHIFLDRTIASNISEFEPWLDYIRKQVDVDLQITDVQDKADLVLSQLDSSVQAAYLTPGLRMPRAERKKLIDGLNQRKIPTFSMIGVEEVQMGSLAAQAPAFSTRVSRRIALNVKKVLQGVSPNEIAVDLPIEDQLVINDATARQIDFAIPFEIQSTAELINEDVIVGAEKLSLEKAISTAIKNNPRLQSFAETVILAEEGVKQARSSLLPQLTGTASYSQIDEERAEISMGSQAEKSTRAGVALSQLLFNDAVITDYRVSKYNQQAAIEDYQAELLDLILNVHTVYYDYLQALASYRVAIDNLKRTQHHLSLSQVRHHYGAAGPSEVFRWETEEAQTKTTYFNAWADVQTSLNSLNRFMGMNPNTSWDPEDIALKDPKGHFLKGRLDDVITDTKKLDQFTEFATIQGFENAPEIQALTHQIGSQRLLLAQEKRSRFLPTLSLSFRYDNRVDDDFIGVTNSLSSDIDDEWTTSVEAQIPLFTGGLITAKINAARAELRRQLNVLEDTQLIVAQRIHTALNRIGSSYPSVRSTAHAADRALKTLEIIREEYAEGKTGILDLLDAQNQSFSQEQEAVIASYTYLRDLAEFHRAISWFKYGRSEEEVRELTSEIINFIMEQSN